MLILAIDTSQENGYVALYKDAALLFSLEISAKMQTAALLEKVDQILKKSEYSLDLIDIFAVCVGPGSFTGTRIGVITAKTLAFAQSKKVVGYSSFIGRTPQMAFLSKKKAAILENGNINYLTIEDPSISTQRELDLSAVGVHIKEKGQKQAEEVAVFYPKAL